MDLCTFNPAILKLVPRPSGHSLRSRRLVSYLAPDSGDAADSICSSINTFLSDMFKELDCNRTDPHEMSTTRVVSSECLSFAWRPFTAITLHCPVKLILII